ncbi:MAG: Peptidase in kexin sedolisin [Pseudonocardiales bacterium]|nr:Peptidase in kexin sedolisin [Pseudonocardiales bacterium]
MAALVASAVTSTSAGATPLSATRPSPKAGGVPKAQSLKGKIAGQSALPRAMGKQAPAGGEPGKSGPPAGVPSHGSYAFLLQLRTQSTLTAFRGAAARGKSAASTAAKQQFTSIKAAQARVVSALPSGSRVMYRTHSVLAGVAVYTDVHNFSRLQLIGDVAGVYPIAPKQASNSYAVPLQGAPSVWTAYGDLGQNSTIAIIDTGIDYTHANFGGPGTVAAYTAAKATDAAPAAPTLFPSAKIIQGYDLAGDDYNADPSSAAFQPVPHPDLNPLDCAGHGSHVAGTAAGYGVTSAGATYAGAYDSGTPFGTLRIGPGMAPQAKLMAYKVFGCEGSTDVVTQAIDMAADPNGDGDPSDHASVINMSLGSDYGSPQDGDSVATNAASQLGISVVAASGNGGDYYDVGGSPGNAVSAIAAANSVDAYSQIDALNVSAPAVIAGSRGAERSIAYDWTGSPDLSGTVVALTSPTNKDGCAPLNAADAAAVNGKIAFLEWTDDDTVRRCGSVARSGNVAAAGATGFIFADDQETFSAEITGSTAIPGVLVVKSAGDAIRAHLADVVTVSGTVANGFKQLIPADNDKVSSSSSRGMRGAGNVKPDVTAVGTSVFSTAVGTGSQGVSFTGTSMATPMIAGLAALVRSQHSDWNPEEVKADIMNTAGQDLYTGTDHSGDTYAPNRVGAGRIDAKAALDNSVLAYVQDDPGAVSASFGPLEVTGPLTLTKTIKVVNKGLSAATYAASYDAITTVPGVDYTVSPSSVTVDPQSIQLVTLTLSIPDPTALTKTIDPTMSRDQAGLPREYVADASGRVLLTPAAPGTPVLRVPVYSAPRPASQMTQPASLTLPAGPTQTGVVPLSGQRVNQGAGNEQVQSLVSGFELQAVSGLAPNCSVTVTTGCVHFPDERSADLKYVGVTTDAPQLRSIGQDPVANGLVYFSITTQGPWRTAASAHELDIYIDTNGDNQPDVLLFNTRLSGQDIFVSELVDLNDGSVLDVEPINDRLGDVDTALFDSNTMVLPVAISALPGITGSHPRFSYGVAGFSNAAAAPVDTVGLAPDGSLSHPLSVDVTRPGVAVYGSFDGDTSAILYRDSPGSVLVVRRDAPAYAVDHGLGALFVHFQNKVGAKAQRVLLKTKPSVTVKLSATKIKRGHTVTVTVTVSKTSGAVPTGKITLQHLKVGVSATATLVNGTATFRLTPHKPGTYVHRADYSGDGDYLPASSANFTFTVT